MIATRAMFEPAWVECFWSKVEKLPDSPGCWLWTGTLQTPTFKGSGGYGVLGRHGRTLFAHRVAYELLRGPIQRGLVLDHLCRVRCCVNPRHLEPVTPQTNILRGTGYSARNARRTHCPKGHPLDGMTRRYNGNQAWQRYCRQCNRDNVSRRYAEKRRALVHLEEA